LNAFGVAHPKKKKHKPKSRRYMEIHIPLLQILVDGTQKEGLQGQCLRN